MNEEIKEWVAQHEDLIKSTYHHLHINPEVSWKEVETTKYIISKLMSIGIPTERFDSHTGVVGYWGDPNEGPTIGIRADMDALYQLVDGEWKANHSCGHDAHMTIVLHAITCLKKIGFTPKGLIKLIFQPAEETGKGAQALIEKGVIEDIDYMLGIHLRPIQEMEYGKASPGIYHGATTLLRGEIKGIQAHGARPHLGINVVDSIGAIIQAVNSIKMDPTVSASVKVTMIKAGGVNLNTIPDYAEFGIDVRAERNEIMSDLLKQVEHAVVTAGSMNHAEVSLRPFASMVAADPSVDFEELVKEAIIDALGDEGLVPPPVTPGGEDFHFYKSSYPNLQATMVGLGTGLAPGLHHPHVSFNLDSILNGVKIVSMAITKVVGEKIDYSR